MSEPQLGLRLGHQDRAIAWVAGKKLVPGELPHLAKQHELNGSEQLRAVLGDARAKYAIRWLRTASDEDAIVAEASGRVTWYDSRKKKEYRDPEFRLYYDSRQSEDFLRKAAPGDLALLMGIEDEAAPTLLSLVIPSGSSYETQLCWLFGLDPDHLQDFSVPDPSILAERAGRVEAAEILEAVGLVRTEGRAPTTDLATVRNRFGEIFPPTAEMSEFAREIAPADARQDPDGALMTWLQREEELFRALEEYIVIQKLDEGFAGVDDFISFSLSVQNRRKARMGLALENHLRAVFDVCGLSYSHQAVTENNGRPDFVFPGIEAYHDLSYPAESLRMLGAKSTCKDRWSQVLSEADRIPIKHLCTIEPGISESRTDEMDSHGVRLVVPEPVQSSYSARQRGWMLKLSDFIAQVGS